VTRRETDDEEQIITGFLAKPVFRYEDTNGEPLKNTTLKLPDLPLLEKVRIPAKTATYSGNNFTTYTFIQFPC
jgi:hypothetical protein